MTAGFHGNKYLLQKEKGGLNVRTFQDGSKAFKMKMGWMLLACGAAYRIPKKRRKSEVTISTAKGFEREKTESILMQTWLMTGGVGRQELAFDQRDEEHDITHSTLPSLPNVELSPRGLTN